MDNLSALEAMRLRFHLKVMTPIVLPAYKGSTFHGGFGWALKQVAPLLYRHLFDPTLPGANGASIPKSFVLIPPLDPHREYPAGAELSCELVLIGPAIQHLSTCICAMDRLGREGIGRSRGHFAITRVEAHTPSEPPYVLFTASPHQWLQPPPPVTGQDLTVPWQGTTNAAVILLSFQTRVRLQADNRLVRTPPTFSLFMSRLLGRLNMLAWAHKTVRLVDDSRKHELLEQAREVEIQDHSLTWDDWSRYSGRQKEWMKFGGLLGDITYRGNLPPFMPYLALGEWFHVGGKTSFGLGKYKILRR